MLNKAFIRFTLGFVVILAVSFIIIVITNYWIGSGVEVETKSSVEVIAGE